MAARFPSVFVALCVALCIEAAGCAGPPGPEPPPDHLIPGAVDVVFSSDMASSGSILPTTLGMGPGPIVLVAGGEDERWIEFDVQIDRAGTYRPEVVHVVATADPIEIWLEIDGRATERLTVVNEWTGREGVKFITVGWNEVQLSARTHRVRVTFTRDDAFASGVRFVRTSGP